MKKAKYDRTRDEMIKEANGRFHPSVRNGLLMTDLTIDELHIALASGIFPKRENVKKFQGTGAAADMPVKAITKAIEQPVPVKAGNVPNGQNGHVETENTAVVQTPVKVQPAVNDNPLLQLGALIQQVAGQAVDTTKVQEMIDSSLGSIREEVQALAREAAEENTPDTSTLTEAILTGLVPEVERVIDEKVAAGLANIPSRGITIHIPELSIEKEIGQQHHLFPTLLKLCTRCMVDRAGNALHIPVMLVGPAGSGKTTACRIVSEVLGLDYYELSITEETGEHTIVGYRDAHGNYHGTPFRQAYEFGGVCCIDECDKGRPGVMAAFNAGLANESMTFPDGQHVTRHKDFIAVATANTYGKGPNRVYVGSNRLDGATIDRFFFLEWGYSEALEAAMVGVEWTQEDVQEEASGLDINGWFKVVTRHRKACMTPSRGGEALPHVVSPRATLYGAHLLDLPRNLLMEGLIWKGCQPMLRAQIEQEVSSNG